MNPKSYKYCAVPQCKSTTFKFANKLFICVPRNPKMRKTWLKLARRDPASLSASATFYFCEDHFDIPNDMANYMEYSIMGSVSQIRMIPGCIPKKFECQQDKRKRTSIKTDNQCILNKQGLVAVEECLKKEPQECPSATHHVKLERIINTRRILKKGAVPSIFDFTKIHDPKPKQRLDQALNYIARKSLKKTAVPSIFPWKTDFHRRPSCSQDQNFLTRLCDEKEDLSTLTRKEHNYFKEDIKDIVQSQVSNPRTSSEDDDASRTDTAPSPCSPKTSIVIEDIRESEYNCDQSLYEDNHRDRQNEKETQHDGIKCNQCYNNVEGFRYVCVECPDFDLCSACEARGVHDTHYVLRIPEPRPQCEIQEVLQRIRREIMKFISQTNHYSTTRQQELAAMSIKEEPDIKVEPSDVDFDPLEDFSTITTGTIGIRQSQRSSDNLSTVSKDVRPQTPVKVCRMTQDVLNATSSSGSAFQDISIVKIETREIEYNPYYDNNTVHNIVKKEPDEVEESNQHIGRKRGKQSDKLKAKRSKIETRQSTSIVAGASTDRGKRKVL